MTLTIALNILVLIVEVVFTDKRAQPLSLDQISPDNSFSALSAFNVDHIDQNKYIVICDSIFLSFYLVEFILKIYCEPIGYWYLKSNIMD